MAEEAVKQRIKYAKDKAQKYYERLGAEIVSCDNRTLCFLANFTTHENKVRVTLDTIKKHDIELISRVYVFPHQTRQIWCDIKGKRDALLVEVMDSCIKILYHPLHPDLRNKVLSIPDFLQIP